MTLKSCINTTYLTLDSSLPLLSFLSPSNIPLLCLPQKRTDSACGLFIKGSQFGHPVENLGITDDSSLWLGTPVFFNQVSLAFLRYDLITYIPKAIWFKPLITKEWTSIACQRGWSCGTDYQKGVQLSFCWQGAQLAQERSCFLSRHEADTRRREGSG